SSIGRMRRLTEREFGRNRNRFIFTKTLCPTYFPLNPDRQDISLSSPGESIHFKHILWYPIIKCYKPSNQLVSEVKACAACQAILFLALYILSCYHGDPTIVYIV